MKFYKNVNDLIVGAMNEKNIYMRDVDEKKHLLKVMDAWGIDASIVEQLKADGCVTMSVRDKKAGVIYGVSFAEFCDKGVERNFGNKQIFLPRKYWLTKKI